MMNKQLSFVLFLFLNISCILSTSQCEKDLESILPTSKYYLGSGHGNYGKVLLTENYDGTVGGEFDLGKYSMCGFQENSHFCWLQSKSGKFSTKYYTAACVPKSCVPSDTNTTLLTDNAELVISKLGLPQVFSDDGFIPDCVGAQTKFSVPAIIVLTFISILTLLTIIGTILDIEVQFKYFSKLFKPEKQKIDTELEFSTEYLPINQGEDDIESKSDIRGDRNAVSLPMKLILAWSAYHNYQRLVSTPRAGSFDSLNGTRCIAMSMVVLGHVYFFSWFASPLANLFEAEDMMKTLPFQIIEAGYFAVDTFFWLSGFLVSYLFLKNLYKTGFKKSTLPMFYIHRYIRLTVPLFLALFFFWYVSPFLYNGPIWKGYQTWVNGECNGWGWLRTLLYIQNFANYIADGQMCMGWSWYLANDMQFFIISPIILLAYFKNKKVGWGLTIAMLILCIACNLGLTWGYNIQAFGGLNYVGTSNKAKYIKELGEGDYGSEFDVIYSKPWTRCGPYFAGFILSFILLEREKDKKVYLPRLIRYMCYVGGSIVLLVLSFITWTVSNFGWNLAANVIYEALARTFWGLGLSFLFLPLCSGYGGFLSKILAAPFWVPFARLTYGAYLYHLINLGAYYASTQTLFFMQFNVYMYNWVSSVIVAFLLSFLQFLIWEKPIMNLESLLLFPKSMKK